MKVYISADMEGITGVAHWDEVDHNKPPYSYFQEQMSKDIVTFLMWAAEPHLEQRHAIGFKVIIYLLVLTILVYLSMKKIWSRIETKI